MRSVCQLCGASLRDIPTLGILAMFATLIPRSKSRFSEGSGQTLSVLNGAHSVMQGSLLRRSGQRDRQGYQPALGRRQPDRVINFGPGSLSSTLAIQAAWQRA